MSIAEAVASGLFSRTRKLGKLAEPRDHVAGCIALNKRNQMLDIARTEPSVLESGGTLHLARWENTRGAHQAYMAALHEEIDRQVTFLDESSYGGISDETPIKPVSAA